MKDRARPTADDLTLALYQKHARPIIARWFNGAACIGATRLAVETLRRFDIKVTPVVTQLLLQCAARKFAYFSGFTPEERDRIAGGAGRVVERLPGNAPGYCGHVIGVTATAILDSTLHQATSVENDFIVPVGPLIAPLGRRGGREFLRRGGARLRMKHDDGTDFTIDYRVTKRTDYLESAAWNDEAIPLLAAGVCLRMTAAGLTRAAIEAAKRGVLDIHPPSGD